MFEGVDDCLLFEVFEGVFPPVFDGQNLSPPETNSSTPIAFLEGMAPVIQAEITADYSDEMAEIQSQLETPTVSKDLTVTLTYQSNVLTFALKNMEWKEADPSEMTHGSPTRDSVGEFAAFAATGEAKEDISAGEEPITVTLAS